MNVNPFAYFPKELWEMILKFVMEDNPVKNSKDVLSVLHAFPVFQTEFPLLKEDCLILQVLSFLDKNKYLYSGLDRREIVKCRAINKRWCRAVDAYLNCQPLTELQYLVKEFYIDNDTQLNEKGLIIKFMEDTENHPASRNPFIAKERLLVIGAMPLLIRGNVEGNENEVRRQCESDCQAQEKYMENILKVLTKYGKHIWNFRIEFDSSFLGVYRRPLVWANLDKIFQLLPNLKYFYLFKFSDADDHEPLSLRKPEESALRQCLDVSFPELPRLEELFILFSPYTASQAELDLWSKLVQQYAANLKVLRIKMDSARENGDEEEEGVFKFLEIPTTISFPALKELVFEDGVVEKESLFHAINHLLSLDAPNLKTIKFGTDCEWIRYRSYGRNSKPGEWKQLLQKLKRFPALKRFTTNYCFLGGEDDLSPEEDALLSLEDFVIYDYLNATYNVLRCFPNLKHFKIQSFMEPSVVDLSVDTPVKIREEIQTAQMYQSNIWQLLPKLKAITLLSGPSESMIARVILLGKPFTRDNYEKLKPAAIEDDEDRGDSFNLFPLRPDIINYLRLGAEGLFFGCHCCKGHPQSSKSLGIPDVVYDSDVDNEESDNSED